MLSILAVNANFHNLYESYGAKYYSKHKNTNDPLTEAVKQEKGSVPVQKIDTLQLLRKNLEIFHSLQSHCFIVKKFLNKSPQASRRQIFRLSLSQNFETHQIFLQF